MKDLRLPSWETRSVPCGRRIGRSIRRCTRRWVDRRRYSGDWWKVQQEEARAYGKKKALRRRSGRVRRVQTGAAQDGGKESALNALRSPNAIAVPEAPLIVAKLGEQFCTDADGSTSAGHYRMAVRLRRRAAANPSPWASDAETSRARRAMLFRRGLIEIKGHRSFFGIQLSNLLSDHNSSSALQP